MFFFKKKKKNPNTNTRPPQSSNGNAKAKPKIRNPKEKNLIKDNAIRLRLKPHHQAHRLNAATTPPPKTQATELGSALEIGPIGLEFVMLIERERELSVCDADRIKACDTSRYFTLYFFVLSLFLS